MPGEGRWEFDYLLRPRNERVKEVPSLVIIYFRPGLTPAEKGYMTTSAPAIPLQVTTRAKVEENEIQGKKEGAPLPDRLYKINRGPVVLQSEGHASPPTWLIVILIIGPAVLTLSQFVWWSRQNPDAARRSRWRRSRAARQALRALESIKGVEAQEKAGSVVAVVSEYLKERFDLQVRPSGPQGSDQSKGTESLPPELSARIAELFQACDWVRYAPPPIPNWENLKDMSANLILDLELSS